MRERLAPGIFVVDRRHRISEVSHTAALLRKQLIDRGVARDDVRLTALGTPPEEVPDGASLSACRIFRTSREPVAYVFNYRRIADDLVVRMEPLEWVVDFAEQLTDCVLVSDTHGVVVYTNHRSRQPFGGSAPAGSTLTDLATEAAFDLQVIEDMARRALQGDALTTDHAVAGLGTVTADSSPFRYCGATCGVLWTVRRSTGGQHDRRVIDAVWHQLGATMQHRVRNPLQVLQAGVQMLRDRHPSSAPQILDLMERTIREISEVLAERVHAAGSPPAPPQRLSSAVALAIASAQARHATCQLTFKHKVTPDEPTVAYHLADMMQVCAAIFRNAADAQPDSAITIRYTWDHRALTCRISDTGPGFPEAILARRFLCDDPTRQIGMALVASTLEGLGGTAQFANAEGGGASVELRLPVAAPPDQLQAPAAAQAGVKILANTSH